MIMSMVGGKRVNNNKDAPPGIKAKAEGNNAGDKGEGEATLLNELCISIGDKTEEEEVSNDDGKNKLRTDRDGNAESSDEGNRLRGLLADSPKKLSKKDVDNVIRYLEVDEIVSLALKSGQRSGSDGGEEGIDDDRYVSGRYVPTCGMVLETLGLMLEHIERVEEFDLWVLYKHLPRLAFAPLLLTALDSYNRRCCDGVLFSKAEDRDMIPVLCRVLPWKLFVHVLYYKTKLPLFKSTESEMECTPPPVQNSCSWGWGSEVENAENTELEDENAELEEEWSPTGGLKVAADNCDMCLGKGKHSGFHGCYCSFLISIPKGGKVGPDYWVICRECAASEYKQIVEKCLRCGCEEGKAMLIPSRFPWGLKKKR